MSAVSHASRRTTGIGLTGLQVGLAASALGALLLAPPAHGRMMLVPLTPAAARALPAAIFDGNTRLIASGTLPGSLVVEGDRHFLESLLHRATLTLATPLAGCGA
jgi:hypothetical protein